jgi:hypothetical protein
MATHLSGKIAARPFDRESHRWGEVNLGSTCSWRSNIPASLRSIGCQYGEFLNKVSVDQSVGATIQEAFILATKAAGIPFRVAKD